MKTEKVAGRMFRADGTDYPTTFESLQPGDFVLSACACYLHGGTVIKKGRLYQRGPRVVLVKPWQASFSQEIVLFEGDIKVLGKAIVI